MPQKPRRLRILLDDDVGMVEAAAVVAELERQLQRARAVAEQERRRAEHAEASARIAWAVAAGK